MMRAVLLLAVLGIAACGADGAPEPYGMTVSGTASIGVSGTR